MGSGQKTWGTPHHVLIFPFPFQGHITPMLKLAEVLSLSGIRVTFLNTHHNHRRLLSSPGVGARLASRPGLRLRSIPDGLPEDNPRGLTEATEIIAAFDATAPPLYRDLLSSGGADHDGAPPVTCVVADGLLRFAVDVAEEMGVPIFAFRTCSSSSFWAFHCIPKLIETGVMPFQDGCDLDEPVACVLGTESFLRRRDLPSFCRTKDSDDPNIRFLMDLTENSTRYRGVVFNSAEFAESIVLSHIRGKVRSTYPIGPLHGLLQAVEHSTGAVGDGGGDGIPSSDSTSLWQEDRACMEWLDARPTASVVYVSFGSVVPLGKEQLLELWHGLVNSGYHFLWVVRPDMIVDGGVPAVVAAGREERGFLAEWAPQQEVLGHPAVGCFLTHSGWNSTLEGMWAGVPMVCWPFVSDQLITSRFVSEVWRIGVDIKDTCDRAVVEKAVREVMAGERSAQMRAAAASISKTARESVEVGGSAFKNLERLIRDIIKSINSSTP
ncbi:hypothetical protein Taro_054639 [Colocasia esculenta]|uniref:Glycosyltransferase n=1 Tax=Colocasia esculenta TaxID=4460 RepID=A0A843XQM8_COLES|nr:hypothetical protein [Colocasia esculenta]